MLSCRCVRVASCHGRASDEGGKSRYIMSEVKLSTGDEGSIDSLQTT